MAQFGAAKNPPWVRPATADGTLVSQPMQLGQPGIATPTIYSLANTQPSLSLAQQQYAAAQQLQLQSAGGQAVLPQPGIAIPTTLATNQLTVSYPTAVTRPPPSTGVQGAATGPQTKQRVFTGNVSKLHDNFGFVDEDVFFQTTCVKGVQPKVGDRVLVEATYNANMPFRWNATRIQLLPNQGGSIMSGMAGGPLPAFGRDANISQAPGLAFRQAVAGPQSISQALQASLQAPPPLMGQVQINSAAHTHSLTECDTVTTYFGKGKSTVLKVMKNSTHNLDALDVVQSQQQRGSSGGQSRARNDTVYNRDRVRGGDRDRGDSSRHERRDRRTSPRKRSRSPRRSRSPNTRTHSPQRRRQRVVPRYMVQFPKITLDTPDANVITLKSRYTNLYIPSDFFNTQFTWTDAFPLHRPFALGNQCHFHVMSKEVAPLDKNDALLEPPDADHLYSAKVVLMSSPTMDDIFRRSCGLAEDTTEVREAFQHPTRVLQFLVGLKGKNEPMAIGGPWSPSLDGADPGVDPSVLIRTAIRTTKALTGIDLSTCTQWYRFAEMRYHRPEEMHKGRLVPARIETVVIFLPDVWSCNPTQLEWESLQAAYKKQLHDKIGTETASEEHQEEGEGADKEAKNPTHFLLLDPKSMKVADLRKELEARTLSSKGLKSQMIARLTKAIKGEQEKADEEAKKKKVPTATLR